MGKSASKTSRQTNLLSLPKNKVVSTIPPSSMPQLTEMTVTITPPNALALPDGITIVWLDARVNSKLHDVCSTKIMLYQMHQSVFFYDDVKNCRDFLNTISNKKTRIFLVVSGKFSTIILPNLKTLSAIDSVFIFCAHPEKYQYLVTEYAPHVVDVIVEQETLRLRLEIELNNYNMRAPIFNFFAQKQNATRDLTYDAASFLWFQLLQEVLMKTNFDENDMKEMLDYCRKRYARDDQQNKFFPDIDEFQRTYKSEDAIKWYTRQSFVYMLINTALRTEDIEALYIFRFYISDLCRQLAREHKKFRIQHQQSPVITLYRGCHMTTEELDKLQDTIGGMTSLNGFISTSLEKWVADQFLSHASRHRVDIQKVLWIIAADVRKDDVIFANIAPFSAHSEEEEVLFNIGSAFCINGVTLDETTNVWQVKATATNAGVRAISEYMELIKRELNETSVKVIFGTLLMDMGKYVTAQSYFKDLIQRSGKNHPDLATYLYNLGLIYSFLTYPDLAEQNFQQALEYQKLFPHRHRDEVRTLNALGLVHQDSGEMSKAMTFYRKAESICEQKLKSDDLANAQTYTYLGRYYLVRQQYNESSKCYEHALKILYLHLPKQHQRIGIIYNEMGDVSRKQGNIEQALKLYQQAETIFQDILPQHHPCMAYCWSTMGFVFLKLNDIEEAQRYHKKALKSYKRVLPPGHPNILTSEENSKCINYDRIVESYLQVCSQV